MGFDVIKGVMFVTQDRLMELQVELNKWYIGKKVRRKELESLIGKLQFVTSCVRLGRVFIARMLNEIRGMHDGEWYEVEETVKDVMWWKKYLPQYNGVSIMWPQCMLIPDEVMGSDACLSGIGGVLTGKEYFYFRLPEAWKGRNIAYLEMWGIVLCLRVWGEKMKGKCIVSSGDSLVAW